MEKLPESSPHTTESVQQESKEKELTPEQTVDLALIEKIISTNRPIDAELLDKSKSSTPKDFFEEENQKKQKFIEGRKYLYEKIVKGGMLSLMQNAHKSLEDLGISSDVIQDLTKVGIVEFITEHGLFSTEKDRTIDLLRQTQKILDIPSGVLQQAAKEAIVLSILKGNARKALDIQENFEVSKAFLDSAAKGIMIKWLSSYNTAASEPEEYVDPEYFNSILDIKKTLQLSDEVILEVAEKSIIKRFTDGPIDTPLGAIEIKEWIEKMYGQDTVKKLILNKGIELAARQAIIKNCSEGAYEFADNADKVIEVFELSPEETIYNVEFQQAYKEGLIKRLQWGKDDALFVNNALPNLPKEIYLDTEVLKASKECLIEVLKDVNNLGLGWDASFLPERFFADPDIQEAAKVQDDKLIQYVEKIGAKWIEKYFPTVLQEAREKIFERVAQDIDIADYFVEHLSSYDENSWVAENLTKALGHYSVAKKFLNNLKKDVLWKNNTYVPEAKLKAQQVVKEHELQWGADQKGDDYSHRSGGKGFSESDPYREHPYLFTAKQIQATNVLFDAMTDKNFVENKARFENLGVSTEMRESLLEINRIVDDAYVEFVRKIDSNLAISKEDRNTLISPEYYESAKLTPLLDNVRGFIARYISQLYDGSIKKMNDELGNQRWLEQPVGKTEWTRKDALMETIQETLEEGFKKYIKVCEVDIPLYDKLYKEFDELREVGRDPLEVYLGRDGIYAYIGRRYQDVARRRKLGPKGRKELREKGEVLEIHPKYLVYPRYFRDYLDYQTKKKFLEQEGISPEADPLFYDTGYTGTIPEQIMKVMDFDDEEIEKRIRLLSAPSAHRRVKGISENARSEIIEYIEHNAKLEESAEGLLQDEKMGKIRHIAKPTTPEEQFYFMIIKQAIARHYWLKERLYHEPSGYINRDSEHYSIRIKEEYAELLPKEFIQDPKKFFAEHGELLKGSKGKGEYPDEEVILFTLQNGAEIVAKRIELRKAKEARKEFGILIAARKANLPTADPVGFLSGKEEEDGSYLLMEKVEGISGRKFEKYLQDSGKYTQEQVETILKTVAERNREVAELFREKLKIDKRWRIKDTIIQFDDSTGEVESVIPIDWERALDYDPDNPKEID